MAGRAGLRSGRGLWEWAGLSDREGVVCREWAGSVGSGRGLVNARDRMGVVYWNRRGLLGVGVAFGGGRSQGQGGGNSEG